MILYLGNALSKHGFAPSMMETLVSRLSANVNIISRSNVKNPIFRLLDMLWAVISQRRQLTLVLIDAFSTNAFWYLYATSMMCRLLGVRYAPVLRGGNLIDRIKRNPSFARSIFGHSVVNVCPSGFLEEGFRAHGFPTTYIPNSLAMANYKFAKREPAKGRILWVRSFHKIYNPGMAVRMVSRLRKENFPVTLCMVGPDKDGSLAEAQELCRQLDVADYVTFTGWLSKEAWIKRSEDCDIFLNTTNFDNMPVSVIEAMALGLPVVSTNAGGMRFLIEGGRDGILVDIEDEEAMAAALRSVMTDQSLADRLATAARKKAEGFGWEHVLPLWLELINQSTAKR